MTTLCDAGLTQATESKATERRQHRRHDFEHRTIRIHRWAGREGAQITLGQLVDLSSGGMRIRTTQPNIQPEQQIRVRVELPSYAGISPFIELAEGQARPRSHWTGWLSVIRVQALGNGEYEVAGRLMDMGELDRGMLGLYLSTQPLAA